MEKDEKFHESERLLYDMVVQRQKRGENSYRNVPLFIVVKKKESFHSSNTSQLIHYLNDTTESYKYLHNHIPN